MSSQGTNWIRQGYSDELSIADVFYHYTSYSEILKFVSSHNPDFNALKSFDCSAFYTDLNLGIQEGGIVLFNFQSSTSIGRKNDREYSDFDAIMQYEAGRWFLIRYDDDSLFACVVLER